MKTIIIILAGIGLAAVGWRYWGPELGGGGSLGEVAAESALYTVKRGDMRITVTENGYLKAKKNVEIKPKFRRSSTITWLIEEGTEVALQ